MECVIVFGLVVTGCVWLVVLWRSYIGAVESNPVAMSFKVVWMTPERTGPLRTSQIVIDTNLALDGSARREFIEQMDLGYVPVLTLNYERHL